MTAEPDDLDQLFSAPRERFVALRNELAKRLRGEGKREEAAEVAALRKPTLVAWALNEVSRAEPDKVQELFDAQLSLQAAGSVKALRSASEQRQAIVGELLTAAVAVLEAGGHNGEGLRDRIGLTLLATGTNPEAAESFRRGRLAEEVEPESSWELSLAALPPADAPPEGAAAPEQADSGDAPQPPPAELAAGRRRLERARRDLDGLRERAEALEDRAARAARDLEEATRKAADAADAAAAARREAERGEKAVEEAERALRESDGGG